MKGIEKMNPVNLIKSTPTVAQTAIKGTSEMMTPQYFAKKLAISRGTAPNMETKLRIDGILAKLPQPSEEILAKSGMTYFDFVRVWPQKSQRIDCFA